MTTFTEELNANKENTPNPFYQAKKKKSGKCDSAHRRQPGVLTYANNIRTMKGFTLRGLEKPLPGS